MRIEIEHGAIIADDEAGLWRVLEVTDDGLFLLLLPEGQDMVHTRTILWRQFVECGYDLKVP